VSRRLRYIAADAPEKLADCRCAGCGHIDTPAIREDWWRRNTDDALAPDPATTKRPQFKMSSHAEAEE
jgi:hypothetical protein